MIILHLKPGINIKTNPSETSKTWEETIHFLETKSATKRVYWGSSLEEAEQVHIHIGMDIPKLL